MANKVLLKKSSVAAKVPLTTDLDYGELALNYSDGKLYYKNAANAVTPLSDASKLALAGGAMTGSTTIGTGNYIRFGPNPTWASTLQVGGDGVSAIARTATIASVVTTNGNLHLDSGSDKAAYLNFYSGTGGVNFGNGALATTATVSAAGVFNGTNVTVNGNQTLHAGNYTSYSPTLTGGSASGTWGISVTGTSGSISGYNNPTTAVTANTIAYRDSAGDIAAREFVMSSAVHDDAIPSSIVGVFPTTNQLVKFSAAKTAAFLSGQAMNISGSSDNSNALNSTGYGNGNFTWRQDSGTFAGQTGWASYLISNHGDGSNYFNQTLIMPFYSAPQYSRRVNNVLNGPFTLLSTENYTSYSPTLTGGSASGTWGISVTGSATSVTGGLKTINGSSIIGSGDVIVAATVANFTATTSANPSNVDSPVTLDVIGYCSQAGLPFSQGDGGLYSAGYSTAWYHQIYGDFRSGQIAVRGKNSGTWQAWRTVLDSSNYTNYAAGLSASNSWTGANSFVANQNTASGSSPPLQVYGTNSGAMMSFHRGGYYAVNMGLDSDNVIRIGGWSAAANRLQMDMSGNLTMAGNVTAYSDERLKKDWEVLPINFVQNLALVKVGTFTRIDSEERQVGVSAQSLKNLMPEAVQDDGEYLSVAYGNAALASAVELAKEVVSLNARIARLEALVSKLIEG